jgi:uncharacterized protein YggU (UPF0235/DUF167 family)
MRYPALAYQPEAPSPPGRHPHPEPHTPQLHIGNDTLTAANLTNLPPYQPPGARDNARVAQAAQIRVRLTPRAAREQIAAGESGAYLVRVTAPPVDGRANEALCRLIARRAGVAPSRVTLVRGAKSREKVLSVEGIDPATLHERLLA